ncbi:DoxX family protein [Candidatus Methylospira mobilis]|uniref:DoxX family protein n=2 Tax=Candidatus Methylospira mobilis TaxID=1808979 RepID=A0A5Q0BS86_9GAMM|nr:DoxX family protein [Candidatus Methylospira mobilis]
MNDCSKNQAHHQTAENTCPLCPAQALIRLPTPSRTVEGYRKLSNWLNGKAALIPPFFLSLILAYEFGEAGLMKLYGENWFTDLSFPFPFSLFSTETNWWLATWFELIGAASLLPGIATRFFSFALITITLVAIASVHSPAQWSSYAELLSGYAITDSGHGNYKLPLLDLTMLLPLLFGGAGMLGLDAWINKLQLGTDSALPK